MRIIAGEFRSRKLKSVPGDATRPTPDRLRESLFSILALEIEGAYFVDGYAGTGAVGIEALSRGAAGVTFIESAKPALDVLRENLATLRVMSRTRLVAGTVVAKLKAIEADIIFLDPPYDRPAEYDKSFEALAEALPKLAIVQHSVRQAVPGEIPGMKQTRQLRQGDNVLSFYRRTSGSSPSS